MTRLNVAAAAGAIFLGTILSGQNWAQDGSPDSQREANEWNQRAMKEAVEAQQAAAKDATKVAEKAMARARSEEIRIRKFLPATFGQPRHLTQMQQAAERYSNGKDKEQKETALKQLRELASQYFEEDMQVRQKELQDIEVRLEKLRAQLDRRRAKKDEIVDLQVKVAINDAEGLGFTSAPREDFKFNFRVPGQEIISTGDGKFDVLMAAPPSGALIGPPVRLQVAVPAPPAPPAGDPLSLAVGAHGDAVRLLQKVLNERMEPSPDLKVDGDFGPETEKALRAFQAEHDLDETGEVDEATRERLDLPQELPPFIKH